MTMNKANRPPSMADVAALAGVSHQTVSRVLNGTGKVAEGTRERVLAAIGELGYRRNSVARALAAKRSGILGIITTTSVHFGPASMLVSVEVAARRAGFFTGVTAIEDFEPASFAQAIDHFLGLAVEAIIVIAPVVQLGEALDELRVPVPVIAVSALPDEGEAPILTVQIDQRGGASAAVRHLLDLGHREILHIAGPQDWYEARARLAGWREALEGEGAALLEPVGFGWDAGTGYEAMRELIEVGAVPSAVFAANDSLALGAYKALAEAGLSVPGDVSIVGFDDAPFAEFLHPALTTVHQDFATLGAKTIEMIGAAVSDPDPLRRVLVPATLVVRDSAARARLD